jgi:hypothetical protein
MTPLDLGPWEPLALDDVVGLFSGAAFRWWVAGGHALEVHCGRSWRDHGDVDVGISRDDAVALAVVLDGWQVAVAAGGVLRIWDGEPLAADHDENNLWCRRRPDGPWELDVIVGEGSGDRWVYRRDPAITLPWADALLVSPTGIPYLAPDAQLLFKSEGQRPKDHVDAREVIPSLDPARLHRLAAWLDRNHPWQELLAGR